MPRLLLFSVFCGLAGWAVAAVGQAQEASPQADARIKASIDTASQFLLSRIASETDGPAAIATVALLKSGAKADAPQIKSVCERLCTRITSTQFTPQSHHIYEAGVSLLALANADSKKYRPQIEVLAKYLIANQGDRGQWHYPNSTEGDTSISQYAMLALWEASRIGIVVPAAVWDKAASWHIRSQQRDGGFTYHPDSAGGRESSTHSMTAAGIGSLRIARRHLFPNAREEIVANVRAPRKNRSGKRFGILEPVLRDDESLEDLNAQRNASYVPQVKLAQIDEAVDKGVEWMTTNFTVTNPKGYPIYFLYGLERGATLAELKSFGTHDWYEEGAAQLVSIQGANRGWNDSSGEVPATAFGILFLSKATSKLLAPGRARLEFGAGILVGGRGLPNELNSLKVDDGKVKKSDKKTDLDDLLAQLENVQEPLPETAQTEIVEKVVTGQRAELIGQVDRLKKLARSKDAEVRRIAFWALGRSDDLRLAPILLQGLRDPDVDVYVEARNALRCLSRRVEEFGSKEEPLDAATRARELVKWREWYKSVRAYDERDDLPQPGE